MMKIFKSYEIFESLLFYENFDFFKFKHFEKK